MTYRELLMVEIREILRRLRAQQPLRHIARDTGLDRKTVRRYAQAFQDLSLREEAPLTDDIVRTVTLAVQDRPQNQISQERARLVPLKGTIEGWLKDKLKLTKIHTRLHDQGIQVSYSTLRRFAIDEIGVGLQKPTVLLKDPPPGEEAQADFGLMGTLLDPALGKHRRLWALIITLSCSRYSFVFPTFLQTLQVVCQGLDAAWRFFGGVPKRVVIDNLKAAITKANATAPTINPAFLEYAQARGFFVDAARVRHPKDKARVENHVAYVRESWFAGETFVDLAEAQRQAQTWCREVAGMRIHGTTRKPPRRVFETEEQAYLQPAPEVDFDLPTWTTAKVHPDHHVKVDRALYSLPTHLIGKVLRVRIDSKTVRLYNGAPLVKVHARVAPGERSTDPCDYPQEKANYAFRDIDGLVKEAHKRGDSIGALAQRLLTDTMAWRHMRQAQKLIRIADKYGHHRVNEACRRALSFDVTDVHRIERLVKQAKSEGELAESRGQIIRFPARFARDPETFRTSSAPSDEEEPR